MTEQSANSQDSARYDWQAAPSPANTLSIGSTGIRTTRKDLCPECGERLQGHTDMCPACGENLAVAPKPIRCMHCHTTANSELVVCPGCGRELREAPPKLVTLGAPALLALLLMTLLVTQWERISPIAWARANLVRGVVLVENMGASIEPEMVIVMTPIVEEPAANTLAVVPAENVVVSDTQSVAMAAESVVTPLPDPNASEDNAGEEAESSIMAAAVQESSTGVGGPQPIDSNETERNAALSGAPETLSPETLPTETPLPTEIPLPTDTPLSPTVMATFAATVAPTAAKVEGMAATLASSDAASNDSTPTPTPTWTIQAADSSEEVVGSVAQVAALVASETTLPTPTATPTVATTPLPTPTPTPLVYQVEAGDTLVTIAAQYDIDVEELMAANDISEQDVYALQPGQMLFIPTPQLVVAVSDPSTLRVEAPILLAPSANDTVGCATGGTLMWQRVQFVKDSDQYVLHLGFVDGRANNGQESVTWVVAQSGPVTQTEWKLDTALCDLASEEYDNQWRWWVEVVEAADGESISVSPPSEVRGFVWK